MHNNKHGSDGFSLIEIIISLSIIAIVVGIAMPNYSQHIHHTKRLIVINLLLTAAAQMEHFYAEHHTYVGAPGADSNIKHLAQENNYVITVSKASNTNFVLAASAMQGKPRDSCHIITIDAQGKIKTPNNDDLALC